MDEHDQLRQCLILSRSDDQVIMSCETYNNLDTICIYFIDSCRNYPKIKYIKIENFLRWIKKYRKNLWDSVLQDKSKEPRDKLHELQSCLIEPDHELETLSLREDIINIDLSDDGAYTAGIDIVYFLIWANKHRKGLWDCIPDE